MIHKNRQREQYTFANINLLGNCNADCYFCLGKDIKEELRGKNQLGTHFTQWNNFKEFLERCKYDNVSKLYLTGQTADGLQYKYLDEIVDTLQNDGFTVGVRTNGYLAQRKMDAIQKMKGGVGYSIHTLDPETNRIIMGRSDLPDWNDIIPQSGPNVRVSIVLNRHNIGEFDDLCKYISAFPNVRYIQVRRISTDTRIEELGEDIRLYEQFYEEFRAKHEPTGEFHLAQQFQLYGKEVDFWRTVETSINSLNYFTDGTCSDEYFIVEGYLKNRENVAATNNAPLTAKDI
ncbi:TPA: radical SAM protein [Candidatus Woesearchaeota archaeon]|nr:radical SAM protein [Candidatus Woesearchaeota archaeon]